MNQKIVVVREETLRRWVRGILGSKKRPQPEKQTPQVTQAQQSPKKG